MAYRQVVQPNLDPIMYDDNDKILLNWSGWCLNYVRTCFGVDRKIPRAIWAWQQSNYQHANWDIPSGVFVPIYFDGWYGYGHIAIYKDGQIWSSPLAAKYTADVWGSIQEVERRYGVTYVGWTEDVNGTIVIAPLNETTNTGGSSVETIKSMYWRLLGREADQGGIDTYIKAASARGWEFVYNDLKNSAEGQNDWTRRNPERVASLEAGIQARDVQIQQLQVALQNEQNKPPKEVIKEVEKIVEKPIEVVKEVPVYTHDQATADTVQATSKTVNSIKGMLVNFIGYVKGKLGK